MFSAKFKRAEEFKKIVNSLQELLTEACFYFTPEGMKLGMMDTSRVSLIDMFIAKEDFEKYECERTYCVGLDMKALSGRLDSAANNNSVMITPHKDGHEVSIHIFPATEDDDVITWTLKNMQIDSETLAIPDREPDAVIIMPSVRLQRICRDLAKMYDTVAIQVDENKVDFACENEHGSVSIVVKPAAAREEPKPAKRKRDDDDFYLDDESPIKMSTTIETRRPCSTLFALKYLARFTKAVPSTQVIINIFDEGLPIVVVYKFGKNSHVQYFLAQKLSEDN